MTEQITEQTAPEPTPFGATVMDIACERGFGDPASLDLSPEHADALRDHCGGVEDADRPGGLPLAVAHALGLDPEPTLDADWADLDRISMAWTFGERF
jgi:hypothetical protein